MRNLLALGMGAVLAAYGVAAPSAVAAGAPLQRGDVLFDGSSGLQEYTSAGQLVQTLPGVAAQCIDPNGKLLISPGVGLFDSSGNLLASNWASVAAGRCVADGLGHVYVGRGGTPYTITKYDIRGNLLETFNISALESYALALALAPDECTIYYGSFSSEPSGAIDRLNGCTGAQEPPFLLNDGFVDDLLVLPSWDVIALDDPGASLIGPSAPVQYAPPVYSDHLQRLALDPDGTSFWMCCAASGPVMQFDIATGQPLTDWSPGSGDGLEGVYGPPLVGNADVASNVDHDPAGTAEAFPARVDYSGQLSSLDLYVDQGSTASQVVVGIYSDRDGQPGTLRDQAAIINVMAGSWNDVQVPSISVTAGQRVWIAILGPIGMGTIRFRDDAQSGSGAGSVTSAQTKLTALPATWSSSTHWLTGSVSAYGQ